MLESSLVKRNPGSMVIHELSLGRPREITCNLIKDIVVVESADLKKQTSHTPGRANSTSPGPQPVSALMVSCGYLCLTMELLSTLAHRMLIANEIQGHDQSVCA